MGSKDTLSLACLHHSGQHNPSLRPADWFYFILSRFGNSGLAIRVTVQIVVRLYMCPCRELVTCVWRPNLRRKTTGTGSSKPSVSLSSREALIRMDGWMDQARLISYNIVCLWIVEALSSRSHIPLTHFKIFSLWGLTCCSFHFARKWLKLLLRNFLLKGMLCCSLHNNKAAVRRTLFNLCGCAAANLEEALGALVTSQRADFQTCVSQRLDFSQPLPLGFREFTDRPQMRRYL